jgi:hypothetical protein
MECQGFELYNRKHLIDKNMWQRPNALELKYIMNCADKSKLEEQKQLPTELLKVSHVVSIVGL